MARSPVLMCYRPEYQVVGCDHIVFFCVLKMYISSIVDDVKLCAIYMVTFTINIPQMLAYIPYMDPMGVDVYSISEISEHRL